MHYSEHPFNGYGEYLVADGSGEYRTYEQDLDLYMYYYEQAQLLNEPEEEIHNYWFDYDLMPNQLYRCLWCMGKFGSVEGNPYFDKHDGNF